MRTPQEATATLPQVATDTRESRLLNVVTAVAKAEAVVLRQHLAGTCNLSEWSCSHCEADGRG